MLSSSKKLFTLIIAFLLINMTAFSQEDPIPVKDHPPKPRPEAVANLADIGFGFGLDYGGLIGCQLGVTVIKHITFFGALGYYKVQAGWNIGVKTLFVAKTSKNAFRPFLSGMYGSHSYIKIEGAEEHNKVYNGFTVGLGAEFRMGKKRVNGFDMELNVPIRTPDFWSDYHNLQHDPYIRLTQEVMPIAFSIGFHHEF